MKDFCDLNYINGEFEFDGNLIQSAMRATFENRQTPFPAVFPMALNNEFAENVMVNARWSAFITRNSIDRSTDLPEIIRQLGLSSKGSTEPEAPRIFFNELEARTGLVINMMNPKESFLSMAGGWWQF